jgi:hypothetical protein
MLSKLTAAKTLKVRIFNSALHSPSLPSSYCRSCAFVLR